MNIRKFIAYLASLLFVAFGITSSVAATARATAATTARQHTAMGITSSGQIIDLANPPSWLKPNTLIHPLNYQSPDSLLENAQPCDGNDQCINDWYGGGQGTLLRFWAEGVTNNYWNWWYEGTVTTPDQPPWPFTAGTGINNYYQGRPVYKFAFAPNGNGTGNCISQQLFGYGDNGAQVNTTTCAGGSAQTLDGSKYQYFVYTNSFTLVAVHATNDYVSSRGSNSVRVWLGKGFSGDGNGQYLYLVSNSTYQLAWSAFL